MRMELRPTPIDVRSIQSSGELASEASLRGAERSAGVSRTNGHTAFRVTGEPTAYGHRLAVPKVRSEARLRLKSSPRNGPVCRCRTTWLSVLARLRVFPSRGGMR